MNFRPLRNLLYESLRQNTTFFPLILCSLPFCTLFLSIISCLILFQSHAMCALHNNGYNVSKAIASLVPSGGPILCRDEMEEWSAGRCIRTFFHYAYSPYCSLYIFYGAVKENLFNNQEVLYLVIIFFILMTLMCD